MATSTSWPTHTWRVTWREEQRSTKSPPTGSSREGSTPGAASIALPPPLNTKRNEATRRRRMTPIPRISKILPVAFSRFTSMWTGVQIYFSSLRLKCKSFSRELLTDFPPAAVLQSWRAPDWTKGSTQMFHSRCWTGTVVWVLRRSVTTPGASDATNSSSAAWGLNPRTANSSVSSFSHVHSTMI